VDGELGEIWKEVVVVYLTKATKESVRVHPIPDRYSNHAVPEYN
jgi:hypothetical protein